MKFTAVVDYVKNLFPGRAPVIPSDNPMADANVLAHLSHNMFYTVATNGNSYWYYFVNDDNDLNLAKYILHSNGIKVEKHNSHYFWGERQPVLRVRRYLLRGDIAAQNFVERLMTINTANLEQKAIDARIATVKQKMK